MARKDNFQHDRESAIKLKEKIKRTLTFGTDGSKLMNYTLLKYVDNQERETEDVVQFGYDGNKKIVKLYFKQLFNPRSAPSPLCLQEFVKPDKHIGMVDSYNMLYEEVKQYIYHNDPIVYHLVPLASFSTYFPEIFDTYPYFDFFGAQESCGKTTFLEVLTYSSYYSEFMTVPTLAPIFRTVHEYNCMLGIDEFGKLIANKDNKDLLAMILVGHKRGGTVPRMEEGNLEKVKRFDVFGLKAWTRLEPLPPELLSRAITITMVRNDGRKKLKGSLKFESFTDIRDNFYLCRLEHFDTVKKTYYKLKKDLAIFDRTKDVFLPLLTIAYLVDTDVYRQVLEYAEQYQKDFTIGHVDHWLFLLMEVIIENSFFGEVQVSSIRDCFRDKLILAREINDKEEEIRKITSRRVINYLERLGFNKSPKKTGGLVYYDIRRKKFDEQAFVYLKESEIYQKYESDKENGVLTHAEQTLLKVATIEEKTTIPTIPTEEESGEQVVEILHFTPQKIEEHDLTKEEEMEQQIGQQEAENGLKTRADETEEEIEHKKNPCSDCAYVHIGKNQCKSKYEPYNIVDKFCDYNNIGEIENDN